jgi:hypothetical protein
VLISKSSFVEGIKCHRKLWQLLWDPDSAGEIPGIDKLRMEGGIRFGELAQCLYPDATVIEIDRYNLEQAEKDTLEAVKAGDEVIMEATFRHEQCRVLSDIVIKQPDDTWHLIEVKSSTEVEEKHIPDLAYQKWVTEQCGYPVSQCSVVFADKSGSWPDEKSIFQYEDVTDRVNVAVQAITDQLAPMIEIAASRDKKPSVEDWYSKECKKCEFRKTVCWTDITEPTIYDVIDARKIGLVEAEDIFYVRDIPDDLEIYSKDRKHVDCINSKSINIDKPAIQSMLDELEFPIHFLDFESIAVAVPLFDGNRPWQKLPIQYSVHVLEESGDMRHVEYLHEKDSEPSLPVAKRLIEDIGGSGSVIVYHKTMESGVLKDLADRFPEHAEALLSMDQRIWDLEVVFKKHYRDWRFWTRSSIKVVLPTLLPEFSYEDEEISDGGSASLQWLKMIKSDDTGERQQIADALRSYCALDTLAMVKLLEHVRSVVSPHIEQQ